MTAQGRWVSTQGQSLIAMGLLKLPQIHDYWSKEQVLATPWLPAIMSRDRYFQILQYFHLVDSSLQKKKGETGYDPLFKVRPLLDHLVAVSPISELQLSKHVGYPNAFSKATPTISGYFRQRETIQMADIECFRARSACCIAAEDTG